MELVIELLVELFGEVLLGALISVFDGTLPDTTAARVYRALGYLTLGALGGWLSTLVLTSPTLSWKALRVAWLVVAPVVGGASLSVAKALRVGRQRWLTPWAFTYGALLVGAWNTWRFVALG